MPTSSVSPLPASTTATQFAVSWLGSDDEGGSGVATYDIFVSVNNGPFTRWLDNTTATTADFTGLAGKSYRFYAIATDHVGNSQSSSAAVASAPILVLNPVFQVDSLVTSPAGVVLEFSYPVDLTTLNLFDTAAAGLDVADLTLVGANVGAVRGSLVVDATGRRLTLVPTAGLLPPDDYTLTLRSASDGVRNLELTILDGDENGVPGSNYLRTFTINPVSATTVTVSLADFARGPQQTVNVPANGVSGLPITLSNGLGITSASFELHYDPALLNLQNVSLAAGLPAGATVSLNTSTPGVAIVSFNSPTALPAGAVRLLNLHAHVPATARYFAKQVLDVSHTLLNYGAIPSLGDDAIQVVAFWGDVSGNQSYSAHDAALLKRLSQGVDTGLIVDRTLDPVFIGDLNGDRILDGADIANSLQLAVANNLPAVPANHSPFTLPTALNGAFQLGISQQLVASPGESVIVPIYLSNAAANSGEISSADLVLYFDPRVIDVTAVTLGNLVSDAGSGWSIATRIDAIAGRVFLSLAGSTPLTGTFAGELIRIQASVKANAPAGGMSLNLAANSRSPARGTQLNEGMLGISPLPTDAARDAADGLLTIAAVPANTEIPAATIAGNQLNVVGTRGNDFILVALHSSGNQMFVRVNNQVLGLFPRPTIVNVEAFSGRDFIYVDKALAGTIVSTFAGDAARGIAADLIVVGPDPQFVDSAGEFIGNDDSGGEYVAPDLEPPASERDLALLQWIEQMKREANRTEKRLHRYGPSARRGEYR